MPKHRPAQALGAPFTEVTVQLADAYLAQTEGSLVAQHELMTMTQRRERGASDPRT